MFAEPVGGDLSPVLLDNFNSGQFSKLACYRTARGASESNYAVPGQRAAGLKQYWQCLGDSSASITGGADDKYGRSHGSEGHSARLEAK